MRLKEFLIYGLVDPYTQHLRYVGRSSSGIIRAKEHTFPKTLAQDFTHCGWWLKSLKQQKPKIIIIEKLDKNEDLNFAEIFWIDYFKSLGCPLTNLTKGGQGHNGFKPISRMKKIYEVHSNKTFESIKLASDELNLNVGHISEVLHKKRDHTKGFIFLWENIENRQPFNNDIADINRLTFLDTYKKKIFENRVQRAKQMRMIKWKTINHPQ